MSKNWSPLKIHRYKKIATCLSLCLAFFLTMFKMFAALSTGSLAILSSFIDSLSDIFASGISFVAVKFSLKPPSCTHRYGYFKAESISALIQSAFIAGSGLFVLYSGFERFLHPSTIEHTFFGLMVMSVSLFLTILLIWFQKYVARHTNSLAIEADSAHYVTDVASNLSVIVSLWLVAFFDLPIIDTFTALGVSLYLLNYAYQIAKKSISSLMDRELPDDIKKQVISLIENTKGIKGFHDLRTRDLGGIYFFEIHLEMDKNLSLFDAHNLSEQVEEKIIKKFPNAQIIVHQDPYGIKEKRLDDVLKNCKA